MALPFALQTFHGSRLSFDTANCRLIHVGEDDSDLAELCLFFVANDTSNDRKLLFMFDTIAQRPVFPRDRDTGEALLLSVDWDTEKTIILQNVKTKRFVSAIPNSSSVDVDRKAAANWEKFCIIPYPLPIEFSKCGNRGFLSFFWNKAIVMLLSHGAPDQFTKIVEAIWTQLTLQQFDDLAVMVKHDPALCWNITKMFPHDFWAVSALPALVQSLNNPTSDSSCIKSEVSEPLFIGAPLDHLARDGLDGAVASFAHAVNASLRRTVIPAKGVAIVASARSEGIYLLEWIAHHRILGVEHFFLYTNNNDDGSDELLAALHKSGTITWIQNELGPTTGGISAQVKGYGHALNVLLPLLDYRWALFNDLDEFLVINGAHFSGIDEFARFHEMKQTDAVGINWVMVGSSGQSSWREAPLTRRNTHLLGETNPHIKVMMFPSRFIQAHPHFPFCESKRTYTFRLADGELHEHRKQPEKFYHAKAFSDNPSEELACLYHYVYKSVDEFVWKSSRNRGNSPVSKGTTFDGLTQGAVTLFLSQHQSKNIRENNRIQKSAPGLEDEIERLRNLPFIREAERNVIDTFCARLAEIKIELLQSPRLKQLGDLGEHIKRLVEECGKSD
jgi:hypothetical protein